MEHEFNEGEFSKMWMAAPAKVCKAFKDFIQYPTERNECYLVGYLVASNDAGWLTDDEHSYFMALSGRVRHSVAVQDAIKRATT